MYFPKKFCTIDSMADFQFVLQWWWVLFIIGIIFLPLSQYLFSNFADRGYIFSKTIALACISYGVFLLGIVHFLPFSITTIVFVLFLSIGANFILYKRSNSKSTKPVSYKIIIFEEILFFLVLALWSYVRGHEPSIHGLEKFMDFGFINSLLRTTYFPPKDMWFPPFPINYYYFGHLITALLIKLTAVPGQIGFNLMLASMCAFTFVSSFSLGINLIGQEKMKKSIIVAGILTALLVTFAGNIHPLYSLFHPYPVESPKPPWQLTYSPATFPNAYWYANATRFIPYTIHEFPMYSFVVADLHGHVLDLPFVLLTIALLCALFKKEKIRIRDLLFYAFILSVMYMTNAWDGGIYFLAAMIILTVKYFSIFQFRVTHRKFLKFRLYRVHNIPLFLRQLSKSFVVLLVSFIVFIIPFSLFFQTSSLVHGIGILCAPDFLTKIGHIGPFLFEAAHCQKSPWWQLLILYGFFYFSVTAFIIFLATKKLKNVSTSTKFVLCLVIIATLLIIIPEFIYVKDIYPMHYRANTMFKLVYQAFIILSLVSGYVIYQLLRIRFKYLMILILLPFLSAVFIFPYFAISSYYSMPPTIIFPCNTVTFDCLGKTVNTYFQTDLKNYKGIDGTAYLKTTSVADYTVIQWMNRNVHGQPIILEAQGDSYTDYDRISSYTGLPTVLGWTVHEWLWRGSYDVPSPRVADVQTIYTTPDVLTARKFLNKYNVTYVYVGDLERQKYPTLSEEKFKQLGKVVFQIGNSRLYKLN